MSVTRSDEVGARAPTVRRSTARVLILGVALGTAGCFAIFTLDGYGPPVVIEEGGLTDAPIDDGGVDAESGPPLGKVVFVTRTEYHVEPGALEGPSSADSLCQLAAVDAGLPGVFRAWLSNSAESPSTRFSALVDAGRADANAAAVPLPLITTDNRIVAADFDDLLDAGPRVALTVTEMRTSIPPGPATKGACPDAGVVWTGTTPKGKSEQSGGSQDTNPNCFDWQSTGGTPTARAGRAALHPTEWTSACYLPCNSRARLYCFEQ